MNITLTLTLTDEQALELLAQLQSLVQKSTDALTSEQYTALYWGGRTARSLAREYGVNHNHFIRVWRRLGLDTVLAPSERPKRAKRLGIAVT